MRIEGKVSTGDTLAPEDPIPPKQAPLKSMNQPVAFASRTTYRFQSYHLAQSIPIVSILVLDRQTGKDAMSIFSGDSTFRLDQIGCLVPAMTDRTSACR